PWEVLIIDDANESRLYLSESVPKNVRLIRSDVRLHCGGARNLGLANARFGLAAFCDGDTIMQDNYLVQHCARHLIASNVVTVSLRDYVAPGHMPRERPDVTRDSRFHAVYEPGRKGLVPVEKRVEVRPLAETRGFRDFGYGRLLGPADLPFMVKGSNFVMRTD